MSAATSPARRSAWASVKEGMRPRLRAYKYGVYRLRQSKLAVIGLMLVSLYVLVAIFAPIIAPPEEGARRADRPFEMKQSFRRADELQPPSGEHWFGTGKSGVDLFYGVVWGSRISVILGLTITIAGALVGTILGGAAGYFGGKVDELVMRLTDIFLAMPVLIIAMAISVAIPTSEIREFLTGFMEPPTAGTLAPLAKISIALIIVWWPSYTRLVRGVVLSIRENQYVEAARAVGATDWRIITRHVLPNSLSPILVQATLDIGSVVLLSAALSFIGFGPGGSNFAEWGNLVSQGQNYMQRAWWPVTMPGLAIFGFVLGFNLLGDGLRDLLDPRLRQ